MNSPLFRQMLCIIFSFALLSSAAPPSRSQQCGLDDETEAADFRVERTEVPGGAELLTVFGKFDSQGPEAPLLAVLRDTLGDHSRDNDRLRYVWVFSYARPTLIQRAAAAVPFFYNHAASRKSADGAPPALIDISRPDRIVWTRLFWSALQNVGFDSRGWLVRSSARTYRRNQSEYRKAHIVRALAILSLFEAETGAEPVWTETEKRDIQARLELTSKTFGGLVEDVYLDRVYRKQNTETLDTVGHNWELLRQRAETEGLYFEPLEMPDGRTTHALLWVARDDLDRNREKKFYKRFLNIGSPWNDDRLRNWKGYVETQYFDADNRRVEGEAEGARAVEMIPLAIYGLDHPRVPILLVDFRDNLNPKTREASRRVLDDIAKDILLLSRFSNPYYFLGRVVYDYTTGKRGADINQPSRLRAYSQLKLLLSLNESLDPHLRYEVSSRIERTSINPMDNDAEAEARLARQQYESLMEYAKRPDGLVRQLDRDRGEEMAAFKHGRASQVFLKLANVLSFGLYTHREKITPATLARLDLERSLAFHTRFLKGVVKSTPQVEVVWNLADVRRSMEFITENAPLAGSRIARLTAQVFERTDDHETRSLALQCLYRINRPAAKSALLAIHRNDKLDPHWRDMSALYLRQAIQENQRVAPSDVKAILQSGGQ